jgi:hypothetical protein
MKIIATYFVLITIMNAQVPCEYGTNITDSLGIV